MYYNEHVLCLPRLDWTMYNTLTSLAFENHIRKALIHFQYSLPVLYTRSVSHNIHTYRVQVSFRLFLNKTSLIGNAYLSTRN